MEERLAALEIRLARAERSACLSRYAATLSLVGLVAVVALAQIPAETARKGTRLKAPVEIVDEQGNPRITLVAGGGLVGIDINDQSNLHLVRLGNVGTAYEKLPRTSPTTWGGGFVQLYHANGKKAAELTAVPDGTAFRLWDAGGKLQIASSPGEVASGLSIYNRQGERAVDIGTWERDGIGRLRLLMNEKPILMLGPGANESGSITFLRDGQESSKLP
jgi:hypothetical protein